MDASTLSLITRLFEENAALRKENDELKAKIAPGKPKKVADPNKPKKKYGKLDEETLALVRRENGLKLAEWRKEQKALKEELQETVEVPKKVNSVEEMEGADLIRNWNAFMKR